MASEKLGNSENVTAELDQQKLNGTKCQQGGNKSSGWFWWRLQISVDAKYVRLNFGVNVYEMMHMTSRI